MRIRNQSDFVSGLMYVLLGIAFAGGATMYQMGTPERMGPGYFPFWLGVILAVIGALLVFSSVHRKGDEDRLEAWYLRGLITVLASVLIFGFLLPTMGLVISVAVLVIISSFASREFSWRVSLLNAIFLAITSVLIFVYGLQLQFSAWPNIEWRG